VEIARASYGRPFTAAVRKINAWGVQFHPEKSSKNGLRVVKNFVRLAEGMKT
jgi:glutamine amidotransferase